MTDRASSAQQKTAGELLMRLDERIEAGDYFGALDFAGAVLVSDATDEQTIDALRGKAHCFDCLDAHTLEILAYDEIIRRFGERREPEISSAVDKMIYNRAVTISDSGDVDVALEGYRTIRSRLSEKTDADSLDTLAKSIFNEAAILVKQKEPEEAEKIIEEMLVRLSSSTDLSVIVQIARAKSLKAAILLARGEYAESLRLYDESLKVISRPDSGLPPEISYALRGNRAITIGFAGDDSRALKELETLIRELEKSESPASRQLIPSTLVNMAVAQRKLGKLDDAIITLEKAQSQINLALPANRANLERRISALLEKYRAMLSGGSQTPKRTPAVVD